MFIWSSGSLGPSQKLPFAKLFTFCKTEMGQAMLMVFKAVLSAWGAGLGGHCLLKTGFSLGIKERCPERLPFCRSVAQLCPILCDPLNCSAPGSYGLHYLPERKWKGKVTQSCPTLCDPMDYTVHGILQAWILEWVAFPFSRGSSQPRDRSQVSHITGGFFTRRATTEVHTLPDIAQIHVQLLPLHLDPKSSSQTAPPSRHRHVDRHVTKPAGGQGSSSLGSLQSFPHPQPELRLGPSLRGWLGQGLCLGAGNWQVSQGRKAETADGGSQCGELGIL